jgi:hypothetical protein
MWLLCFKWSVDFNIPLKLQSLALETTLKLIQFSKEIWLFPMIVFCFCKWIKQVSDEIIALEISINQFFSCLCSFIFERAQFVNLLGCIHVMQEDNMASQKPSTSFDSSQTQPYICLKKNTTIHDTCLHDYRGSLPPAVNLYRSYVGLGWLARETTRFRLVRASEE